MANVSTVKNTCCLAILNMLKAPYFINNQIWPPIFRLHDWCCGRSVVDWLPSSRNLACWHEFSKELWWNSFFNSRNYCFVLCETELELWKKYNGFLLLTDAIGSSSWAFGHRLSLVFFRDGDIAVKIRAQSESKQWIWPRSHMQCDILQCHPQGIWGRDIWGGWGGINLRRNLRSSRDVLKLDVPCSKWLWGDRAFSLAAPHLWNHLPYKIRAAPSVNIFKSLLKTHLFSQ